MAIRIRLRKQRRRATPAVRREALVDATLNCLRRYGHNGMSIRRISAVAGVSIGLIHHHFPSKAVLVAEAYRSLAASLLKSIRAQVNEPSLSPRARLSHFFRSYFAAEVLDPEIFKLWVAFWAMAAHVPEVGEVHQRAYREYRKVLKALLKDLNGAGRSKLNLRTAAIALDALLDGLWIELSLSKTFQPREAVAICEDWVDALYAGAFPRLSSLAGSAPRKRR